MKLTEYEEAILAGDMGEPRRLALEHQVKVGRFFDAADMVEVSQVHLMADTESLGDANVDFLERIARYPAEDRRVVVPTVTDPRGADFNAYKRLKQQEDWITLERRTIDAFTSMDVLMTDTCINYQTIVPPAPGEHVAFGDTGSSIYTNSVLGARTNFEGGPSALAAALTGRTPRYGFHLDACRRGTAYVVLDVRPQDWSDWGAVGGIVGRAMASYWSVPVIDGVDGTPTADSLKHFGAALASFGSTPLF
ncbi:MAG: aconitase X catalytic domain-containing protein, partial [Alphaproteobacteria bacterium]|nr:aconitase X catalytic domain-containing protein [Alphaproteobacteria bacterium]